MRSSVAIGNKMAETSTPDTEVSVVNKKVAECCCSCTCRYIKIPPEWAFMTQDEIDIVKENMTQISLFCSVCLSPNSGERSSDGELILRCSRCDHVDVVQEALLKEGVDLDIFTGDIISNRFNRILNFEKEFKKIDLHDPYNIDDDFKRLHEMHASILKAISETTNGVRVIVDGHRMSHNMNVYRERQLLQDQLDNNTLTRKRNKREREKACLVEISGSVARNNFILDPKTFSVPEKVVSKIKHTGHDGVLNIDKMLLTVGLPNVFIKDTMPLYHSRLQKYKNGMQCTFAPGRGGTECETCNCDINSVNMLYKISDDEIMYEDDEPGDVSSLMNTIENVNDSDLLKSSPEIDQIQPKKRKRQKQFSHEHSKSTSDARAQEDLFTMLECLANPREDPTEIDNLIESVAESRELAIVQHTSQKTTDADLDFRQHLGVTSYADDYEEQKFVLGHLCKVQTDDVDKYNIDYVNRVCVEVVDGMRERKVEAKEERRVRIVDYLKLTSKKMCTRVDDVRDDVISQLKMAFQRRIVRNRAKKRLQDQLLERARMLEQLDSDGDTEKLLAISAAEEDDTEKLLAVLAAEEEDTEEIVAVPATEDGETEKIVEAEDEVKDSPTEN